MFTNERGRDEVAGSAAVEKENCRMRTDETGQLEEGTTRSVHMINVRERVVLMCFSVMFDVMLMVFLLM